MREYSTDKEQVELIKKWWNDYGKAIAVAVLAGLIIGFGWRYWQQKEVKTAQQASVLYQEMSSVYLKDNTSNISDQAKVLKTQYQKTPYATYAAFLQARQAVAQKDLQQAHSQFQWVIQNSNIDTFRQVARIRDARVLLAQKQYDAALNVLNDVDEKTYQPMIDAVKGDIYAAKGEKEKAQKAYQAAKIGYLAVDISNPLLDMKLAG